MHHVILTTAVKLKFPHIDGYGIYLTIKTSTCSKAKSIYAVKIQFSRDYGVVPENLDNQPQKENRMLSS